MYSKYIARVLCSILILNSFGCLSIDTEWEDLESDYDHVLNVLGVINLDPGQTSFIGLYRTTDLDEVSQVLVDIDTIGYYEYEGDWDEEPKDGEDGYWIIDSIYEPAALIRDASVIVSDQNGNSYEFSFVEKISYVDTIYFDTTVTVYGYTFDWDTTIYDTNDFRINFYVDTTGTFNPEPETNYQLSITAPGFELITGSLTTPILPRIDSFIQSGVITDSIIISEPWEIFWDAQENTKGMITGEVIFNDLGGYDSTRDDWGYCSSMSPQAIDFSDSSYVVDGCIFENNVESLGFREGFFRLTSMDDNYYEYFITGELGEYSNLLLNYPTTKGRSVGIEGGFGVFGSIGSDGAILNIRP